MGLTLKVEQKLEAVGLVGLHEKHKSTWRTLAKKAHKFVDDNFPNGSLIRKDDVAEALVPVLEVHDELRTFLQAEKLRQRYWFRHFCDLILDRTWDDLSK